MAVPRVVGRRGVDVFLDHPADSGARLDEDPHGIEPDLAPQLVAPHRDLDHAGRRGQRAPPRRKRQAGEDSAAGLDEPASRRHRLAYFNAAAFAGETYHKMKW